MSMDHTIVSSRRCGERWKIKCSCGWFIIMDRYICEEAHRDHAAPTPKLEEPLPRWWDDASYIRYQCDGNSDHEAYCADRQYEEEERKAKLTS